MQEIRKQFEKLTASMYEGDFTQYSPDGDYVNDEQQTNFDMYRYGYIAGCLANKWLPIEEAPKYGQVLIRFKSSMMAFAQRGTYGWIVNWEINECHEELISHFMPVPQPPEKE